MRIAAISDLHGHLPTVPDCDVLVIAGDIGPALPWYHRVTSRTADWILDTLDPWLESIPVPIVAIAGNHDFIAEKLPRGFGARSWHYLCDSGIEIDGVTFWGSPYTPRFGDWAFMDEDCNLQARWQQIPVGTDVLITHAPPYGLGDRNYHGEHCGSATLAAWRLSQTRLPAWHFFGHIHEGLGQYGSNWANVSHVNQNYVPTAPIVVFDLDPAARDKQQLTD